MMTEKELADFEEDVNNSPSWNAWGNDTVKELIQHIRELEKEISYNEAAAKRPINDPPMPKGPSEHSTRPLEAPLGRKDDTDKARWDLLPPEALEEVVNIYTTGAERYGDRNWENGIQYSRMYAAAMRHLQAWWMGEEFDKEQPTNRHLASVAWYCLGLMHFQIHGHKHLDDRPSKARENEDPAFVADEDIPNPNNEDESHLGDVDDIYSSMIKKLEEENAKLRKEIERWEDKYSPV